MSRRKALTAEQVSEGHPDKFCDRVADRILDRALHAACNGGDAGRHVRVAIECLAKDNLLIVSGEVSVPQKVRADLQVRELAEDVWCKTGYGGDPGMLTVVDHIRQQSADIAQGVDSGGAGDQGIMVGYATDETPEMMPTEWLLSRDLCLRLQTTRTQGTLPWLRSDCKSQVSLDEQGQVNKVVVAAQHCETVTADEVRAGVLQHVVAPVLPHVDPSRVTVNGTGRFVIGGPVGDAGVVGRKIVADAYGPRIAVGGGAFSGKDPTKVDRTGAYMARHIAKTAVKHNVGGARECTVVLAYGIGGHQPEMVTATTETGMDLSAWVRDHFPDLSPPWIIDYLGLRKGPTAGWSYFDTAAYGHFGRSIFPWEQVKDS